MLHILLFYILALLRMPGDPLSATDGKTDGHSRAAVSDTCSPSIIPGSLISPNGRLKVVFDTDDGGVYRLAIYDRRIGRILFNGKYDLTSVLWTRKNELILGVGPLYDRPRIVLLAGPPFRGRVLVTGKHRTKHYPDGTDLFVVCSTTVYGGKTYLQYLHLPDVEKIDYGKFPERTIQNSILISR